MAASNDHWPTFGPATTATLEANLREAWREIYALHKRLLILENLPGVPEAVQAAAVKAQVPDAK